METDAIAATGTAPTTAAAETTEIESEPTIPIAAARVMKTAAAQDAIPPADRRQERVLLGGGADQWVATTFSDFNTLTFKPVFDLFRHAVADTSQTALLVHRLICVAPAPNRFRFSEGALRVLQEENAGGASEFSEAVSFELLHRLFDAELLKTEMNIRYAYGGWSKKTDYSCMMRVPTPDGGSVAVAVSVTRAMKFAGVFTQADAFALLYKKLYGCQMSNRDVVASDRWSKQILHIWTEHVYIVDLLRSVYAWMYENSPDLIGNTVVLITLADNAHFLFYNFCADQAQMEFDDATATTTDDNAEPIMHHLAPSQRQQLRSAELFTTPATPTTSKTLRFLADAQAEGRIMTAAERELFYYGYPTLEEALVHNAIGVLQPADPSEEEGAGDLGFGMGGLWADEELGEKGLLEAIAGLWEVEERLAPSTDAAVTVAAKISELQCELAAATVEVAAAGIEGAQCVLELLKTKLAQTIAEGLRFSSRHKAPSCDHDRDAHSDDRHDAAYIAREIPQGEAEGEGCGEVEPLDQPGSIGCESLERADIKGGASSIALSLPLSPTPSCPSQPLSHLHPHLFPRHYPLAEDLHPALTLGALQAKFAADMAAGWRIEGSATRSGLIMRHPAPPVPGVCTRPLSRSQRSQCSVRQYGAGVATPAAASSSASSVLPLPFAFIADDEVEDDDEKKEEKKGAPLQSRVATGAAAAALAAATAAQEDEVATVQAIARMFSQ